MQNIPTFGFAVKIGVFVIASAAVNDLFAIVVDELLVLLMKTLELS